MTEGKSIMVAMQALADGEAKEFFAVKAIWTNGTGGLEAGPYTETLSDYYEDREEVENMGPELYAKWRKTHPSSDGWRSSASWKVEVLDTYPLYMYPEWEMSEKAKRLFGL